MKTFKQYLEEKLATIPTVGALGALGATVAGMYSTSQPNQEKEPEVTQKPFSTPTAQFTTLQPSPDEGKQPTVLNDNKEDAAQRNLRIRDRLIQHIKSKEGFRTKAYDDMQPLTKDRKERSLNQGEQPKGKATIGYGSTYHYDEDGNITGPVKGGDIIDEETALRYINHHIDREIRPHLEKSLPTIFDMKHNTDVPESLISTFLAFAYNGRTDFLTNKNRTSVAQPLIAANKEKDPQKRKELLIKALKGMYDFHLGNGVPMKGLLDRRHDEGISVLSDFKNIGYISPEEYEAHKLDSIRIYEGHKKRRGWE